MFRKLYKPCITQFEAKPYLDISRLSCLDCKPRGKQVAEFFCEKTQNALKRNSANCPIQYVTKLSKLILFFMFLTNSSAGLKFYGLSKRI